VQLRDGADHLVEALAARQAANREDQLFVRADAEAFAQAADIEARPEYRHVNARINDGDACGINAHFQQGVARVLEVAAEDGAQTALLVPADPSTSAVGLAATGADGTVVISMRELAPTTGTQVYEAWVIVGDAGPVPLGHFTVGASGTGVFSGTTALAGPGAILALTLEPGPGATIPTQPVLTIGTLAAST